MADCENPDLTLNVDEQYKTCLTGGLYSMSWVDFKRPGIKGLLKFMWEGPKASIPDKTELDKNLPVIKPNFEALDKEKTGVWVTWLGHACVLVQMENKRILTDPVFSYRCGPSLGFQIGVPRYRDAPCSVAELPAIDAVVISHNHYDHLDVQTIRDLNARFKDLTWFVPFGVKSWMKNIGCQMVQELEWWQQVTFKKMKFVFVPAQHWSKRGPADDNTTLWGGWCIRGQSHSFYFAGDTGYNDGLFKTIGDNLGPFDLAAIPIGAYSPRWFMECQHINPEEALKIHKDVNAKKSIGIHWGTFNLSNEPYLEPKEKIKEMQLGNCATDSKCDLDFFTVNLGESKFLKDC